MLGEVELAVVVSPRDWAERLHRFTMDYGGARVRVRVLSTDDALRESFQVLLIDDITSFLNQRLVQQVQRQGKKVVGVYDGDEGGDGERRLSALGVDSVIDGRLGPEDFLRVVESLAVTDPSVQATTEPAEPAAADPYDRGLVVAVGGAGGGCGATEVALAMATAMGTAVLVDADNVRPGIAQRLGLELHPNLRTAVDALLHDPDRLDRSIHRVRGGLSVVAGLSNAGDWIELRDGDVVDLVRELADRSGTVIANISGVIEDLAYYGGPGRFGLARELVRGADALAVVAQPTPVGVSRLLDWIATARLLAPTTPIHVLVDRAPKSSYQQGELVREIERTYTPHTITFLPEDRRVHEAAWSGELVTGGPFFKAVAAATPAIARTRRVGAA